MLADLALVEAMMRGHGISAYVRDLVVESANTPACISSVGRS